ncbi:MAG: hypothetical protein LUD81_05320, partial [Clostridiales bacterium]|nr:hypothetical protein [Clostridiales bacterium]
CIDSYFYEDSDYYSYPYAELAKKLDITTGEEGVTEWGGSRRFFYPERIAVIAECVSFMLPVLGYVSEPVDCETAYNIVKEKGFITEADSFYDDGNGVLTYEIYETLIRRMLNSKRYMYFSELNSETYMSCDKYRFYDEKGEMTYFEYLVSLCPKNFSRSKDAAGEIIKYNNIISVPCITCLMAVTRLAGMRVDGLFEDDEKRSAIADSSCLEGNELEYVKRKGFYYDNEPDYGREILLFSRTYGIIENRHDSKLYFHENADVMTCVNYIMHIVADIPMDMTDEEIYGLAEEKGIVKPWDSFWSSSSMRLDYTGFKTLLKRMLNAERYIYFEPEDEENWFNALHYDEKGEMTYFDYVKEMLINQCLPEVLS